MSFVHLRTHTEYSIVDGILRWWFSEDPGTTRGRQFVDSSSSGTGGFDGCVDPTLTSQTRSFSDVRADALTVASGKSPSTASSVSLLPILTLSSDPALS